MAGEDFVKQVADQLSKIFRHMLPGMVILCAAAASHPSWFKPVYFGSSWHLLIFAAVAVVAGNTWYVFHRYSLHQAIDYVIYLVKRKTNGGYARWLAGHIYRSFHFKAEDQTLHEHVVFRSAQVIFMFLTSEVALLFSLGPEGGTFYYRHVCWIRIIALAGLGIACWQYVISNVLDVHIVQWCGEDAPTTNPDQH